MKQDLNNIKSFSEDCSAIAFYGIDLTKDSLEQIYYTASQWFVELGCPVEKVSVNGLGYGRGWTSHKHASAKLKKNGFRDITGLTMVSLIPDAEIPMNDYLATFAVSMRNAYALFVCRSSVVSLSCPVMFPFFQKVFRIIKPAYGIGFDRLHRLGPGLFAIGICQGLGSSENCIHSEMTEAEQKEADSISRWGNGMTSRVWEKGLLRDIYQWNFLTKIHLSKLIGDIPLKQWIKADETRGKLISLEEGISLWEVEESRLLSVRQMLSQFDIIFDWKKHLQTMEKFYHVGLEPQKI